VCGTVISDIQLTLNAADGNLGADMKASTKDDRRDAIVSASF
jgi:hypothetical protein